MLGYHLIGSISCGIVELLSNPEKLAEVTKKACKEGGLNIVAEHYHVFDNPKAITYSFILSESHFIVHTWPEHDRILFDVFTCNTEKDAKIAIDLLATYVKGNVENIQRIDV